MLAAVNSAIFPAGAPLAEQLAAARSAGFAGVELVIAADTPLRADQPLDAFAQARRIADDAGVALVGLACPLYFQTHFASADPADRARAVDLTIALLDRAVAAQVDALVIVPAVVGRTADPTPQASYADALNRTFDALAELRFEAESHGVTIALETVWNRFLLSPVETSDLLERVNSPCVGVCVDTGNVLATSYPQDWIATLGRRVVRVHAKDYDLCKPGRSGFCPLGEGSVDWSAVISALRRVRYDGPVIYEGGGEPAEACRRLRNILADRHPLSGAAHP
ncbi:MAG: sugar phosphate isomerase/epimerase family protein [Phycisphaerae bacterium]